MYTLLSGNLRDNSLYNVISLILIFVFILVLAYFTTKLAAKLQGNSLTKNANIKIIESFRLGGNKFISIVKIGEAYYALGFGKDEITMIDKLDEDSFFLPEDKNQSEKKSFKEILISINDKDIEEKIDKK
ncbi:MAG: flagellar biosynthetic protein FliO [Lachnospiraceae bacterium]|nr:flagellar biosynthetic protein FliO [Lachnospiraceae bacterium]